MKQASFLPRVRVDHGGDLNKGRRKTARPFSSRLPLHVVLKSHRARGAWSMLVPKHKRQIERRLNDSARKHRIQVLRFVNVGNHLHLLVKTKLKAHGPARADFAAFLREFAGRVAFEIMGAHKGNAKGSFWAGPAYSRLVQWGKDAQNIGKYFLKNGFEALGFTTERSRSYAEQSWWVLAEIEQEEIEQEESENKLE